MHDLLKKHRLFAVGLCLILLLGTLTGCGDETAELMDTTVLVETQAASIRSIALEETYIATISAEDSASVYPLVSGTVTYLAVSVGDTVSAGDLLCQIDDESAQISLQNAQASYQSAQAGVESAQASYQSAQAGQQSAEANYQNAQAGQQSAEAGYQSALAGIASAEESYQSALAGYGGDEEGNLSVLEEQVRLAEENYENMQALLEVGAVSQTEVDQAYQSMLSAQAGLQSAQASLRAAQAGIDTANAGVASAEAGLTSAEAGIASAEAGLTSANATLSAAEAGIQQAQAGVQSAQVGIDSAEYQLSLYRITAPISGVVETVNVTENNLVSSSSAAFQISATGAKTATFYVTENAMQNMVLGQSVQVESQGVTYNGSVSEISQSADAARGLFRVKATLENAEDLSNGISVSLTTIVQSEDNAVVIPLDALYFDDGLAYVYLAQNGKAVRQDVDTGIQTQDEVSIVSGVSAEDEVVTTWSATLQDGVDIRVAGEDTSDTADTADTASEAASEEAQG